jgi:hypothetical protein
MTVLFETAIVSIAGSADESISMPPFKLWDQIRKRGFRLMWIAGSCNAEKSGDGGGAHVFVIGRVLYQGSK